MLVQILLNRIKILIIIHNTIGVQVKKLLVVIVVATLSFWGCSENSSLTEPTDAQTNQSFLKISDNIEVSELSVEAKSVLGVDDVKTLNKSFLPSSISEVIGDEGGNVRFFLSENRALSIGKLGIAAGELNNTEVTVAMVPGAAALDLTPENNFSTSAQLTVCFMGVNLPSSGADFVYIDEDGTQGEVAYDRIIVGYGWAVVVNAQLNHFSRFGFTK